MLSLTTECGVAMWQCGEVDYYISTLTLGPINQLCGMNSDMNVYMKKNHK